jgi:hypothetical protein
MAKDTEKVGGQSASGSGSGVAYGRPSATRNKRVYAHKMTDAERFALRTVLNAKSACSQLAIAIQEGKPVKPEIVRACADVYAKSGDMLFS